MSTYMTENEVSKMTSLSLSKLRQDRFKNQGFPYYKIGRAVRYHIKDINQFMEQHRICPQGNDLHKHRISCCN